MLRRSLSVLVLFLLLGVTSRAAEDQYFNSNGVKIHYTVEGRGEPVLLIHGFADDLDAGKGLGRLLIYLNPAGRRPLTEDQLRTANALLSTFNDTKALAAVVRSWDALKISDRELEANRVPALAIVGEVDPL